MKQKQRNRMDSAILKEQKILVVSLRNNRKKENKLKGKNQELT